MTIQMDKPSPDAYMAAVPSMPGGSNAWAARYGAALREIIVRQAHRQPRNVQRTLGPSEIGQPCDRQVVGKLAGVVQTNHVSDPWPSVVGTAVHAWLAEHFQKENTLNGVIRWVPEQKVYPHPDYPGTADIYDAVEQCVVDWKGNSVYTPIPTPDGWTMMGRLQPGDTVFGANGRPCRVVRTYPVQYRDCYRITFDDGSDLITDDVQELPFVISGRHPKPALMSTAEATGQVWSTAPGVTPAYTRKDGTSIRGFTRQTPGRHRPQRQLRVYSGEALDLPDTDLIVHPYVLGCWTGDGGVHGGTVSKPDDELFEHIRSCGYQVGAPIGKRGMSRTVYGLSGQLRQLGLQWRDPAHPQLHSRLAGVKKIPPQYLRSSYAQRLALLQGLMDTDGTWNKKRNQAVFTSTDKALAEQVAELVTSLGWKARVYPHQARGFGLSVTEYMVVFVPYGANPFRLSRKADLVRLEGTTRARYRIVKSIEPVLSVPTRCIDVDSPDHLYLAGEQMIPVHNCLGPTSMAKVKSPGGPPPHYQIQLLLYALGYRNLGLPVRRIALVALPRTAATLDSMYVWGHDCSPNDDVLIEQVLDRMKARRAVAQAVMARQIRIEDVPRVPGESCFWCPQFRPQAAMEIQRTGAQQGPGCPGHSLPG